MPVSAMKARFQMSAARFINKDGMICMQSHFENHVM